MDARECAATVHPSVSRVGGAFMVDAGVAASANALGLTFFEFYVVGRAGVLGPVDAAVVQSQLSLLEPSAVAAAWTRAVSVTDPYRAALAYAQCNRAWGRRTLGRAPHLARTAVLAATLVGALPVGDLPLVAGWRDLRRPDDAPALVAHLLQTLREFRGAVHALAVVQAGLTPVEAIVAGPDGPQRAPLLGWPGPYPDPVPLATRRRHAEELTDADAATPFETLTPAERTEFVRLCEELRATLRPPS